MNQLLSTIYNLSKTDKYDSKREKYLEEEASAKTSEFQVLSKKMIDVDSLCIVLINIASHIYLDVLFNSDPFSITPDLSECWYCN